MKSATIIAIAAISGTTATSSPQRKRTRQIDIVQFQSDEAYDPFLGLSSDVADAEELQYIERNARKLQGSMDVVDDIDNPPLDLPDTPVPNASTAITMPTYSPSNPWPTYAPTPGDGTGAPSMKEEEVVASTMATTIAEEEVVTTVDAEEEEEEEGTAAPTQRGTDPPTDESKWPTYMPAAASPKSDKATAGDTNSASVSEVVVTTLLLSAAGVWMNMN